MCVRGLMGLVKDLRQGNYDGNSRGGILGIHGYMFRLCGEASAMCAGAYVARLTLSAAVIGGQCDPPAAARQRPRLCLQIAVTARRISSSAADSANPVRGLLEDDNLDSISRVRSGLPQYLPPRGVTPACTSIGRCLTGKMYGPHQVAEFIKEQKLLSATARRRRPPADPSAGVLPRASSVMIYATCKVTARACAFIQALASPPRPLASSAVPSRYQAITPLAT